MATTLISGGTVVTSSAEYVADVLVEDGTIVAIGSVRDWTADKVIDASGCLVLPGGVDPHVHFETPSGGTHTADSFTSGTIAAAFGGTTTSHQFCVQDPGEAFVDTIYRWKALLKASPPVGDVAFHLMITDMTDESLLAGLFDLPGLGVRSLKVFMAGESKLDADKIFQIMQVAADAGLTVMVHAEDGDVIDVLVKQATENGDTTPAAHARTRPAMTESMAVARALDMAELAGAELYFVHISSPESVAQIVSARRRGQRVTGETCPQYLLLDESILEGDPAEAAKYVFTPPPRSHADRESLWTALKRGDISTVASDHGGYVLADKQASTVFSEIPQGLPGIQQRIPLLYEYGVCQGSLSLQQLVDVTSTNPAKLFGLFPRKGSIDVGADADIVIFDPTKAHTFEASTSRAGADYEPYEGSSVRGSPRTVLIGGRIVIENNALSEECGTGHFVPAKA